MSILLSVNPPFAGWLVDGEKTIEWRTKPLPVGKAYIYETKKNGGCGMVIGEVEIQGIYNVSAITLPKAWVKFGKVSRAKLQTYSKGKPFYGNSCFEPKRYDKPLPLSEFERPCPYHNNCFFCKNLDIGGIYEPAICNYTDVEINRQPQSWCYCEDLKGESE